MSLLLAFLAIILLLWCALLYIRFPAPLGFLVIFPKLAAGAWAPFLAIAAALVSLVAGILRAPLPSVAGGLAAVGFAVAFYRLTAAFDGATAAFGAAWDKLVPGERRAGMLRHRWVGRLPGSPEPRWERDLPFWTIPGTDRALLCDLWQPAADVQPSGLAYLYFHGSAWYIFDKDMGTRQLFRHLAAQGHVVMDVAYRLFPETDVAGMAGDVKRAIAWMKEHAAELGVDPARIVIGGSSAGGHLAQLVGYAPTHPAMTPADVAGADLSVAGVVSCYGPSDLRVCYQHTNQHKTTKPTDRMPDFTPPAEPSPVLEWLFGPGTQRLGLHKAAVAGRLDWLLGGRPEVNPAIWELYSPIHHVHPDCPPTLLMQGAHDLITQAEATEALAEHLRSAGVPVINLVFPYADHGCDLMLMRWSPAAQSHLYELERFLGYLATASRQHDHAQAAV